MFSKNKILNAKNQKLRISTTDTHWNKISKHHAHHAHHLTQKAQDKITLNIYMNEIRKKLINLLKIYI